MKSLLRRLYWAWTWRRLPWPWAVPPEAAYLRKPVLTPAIQEKARRLAKDRGLL